jgi:dipeptidyl aminopeptidase/acylaminoacyl peptidase
MTATAPHIRTHRSFRTATVVVGALLLAALLAAFASASSVGTGPRRIAAPRELTITYTAFNGIACEATVLLPGDYRPGDHRALPLVISPHGRGATGRSNAGFWGNLPSIGEFAVINPDGMGRVLPRFSYGYRGEIDDLARMPQILTHALPWVRIDASRIYALGSSMGGQETLLLVARHPHLLAGAVAMDSVTDLGLRYRQIEQLPTSPAFAKHWGTSVSACLQSAMRHEIGGTPAATPRRYADRSPLHLAHAIAASGVPLQIWWSRHDRIVIHQETQSGALYRTLRRLGTAAPVTARVGSWAHSREMRSTAQLPIALCGLGLLPSPAGQL